MDFLKFFVSVVIWFVFSFTVVPFFVFVLACRFMVGKIVPYAYKGIHRLLNPSSAIFVRGLGNRMLITICFGFEGEISLEEARSKFESSVIYKKDPSGNLQWPELQQFVINKFGYAFWQWDPAFNIKNHFRIVPSKDGVNRFFSPQDVLNLLQCSFMETPFPLCRSPWEIVIVPNFKDDPKLGENEGYVGTLIVFCFDHCIAGGPAISNVFQEYLDASAKPSPLIRKNVNSGARAESPRLMGKFQTYFFGPYNICRQAWKHKAHVWKPSCPKSVGNFNVAMSPTIPGNLIKNIRHAHQVSFTAVILTALGKGLKKFLTEAGYVPPEILTYDSPYILSSQPIIIKLRNQSSFVQAGLFLEGGVGALTSNEASIKEDEGLENPRVRLAIACFFGSLWNSCRNKILKSTEEGKIYFTNMAFFQEPVYFEGRNLLKTVFEAGKIESSGAVQRGSVPNVILVSTLSGCSEGVRLQIQIDNAVVSSEKLHAEILVQYFMQEIIAMNESCPSKHP